MLSELSSSGMLYDIKRGKRILKRNGWNFRTS